MINVVGRLRPGIKVLKRSVTDPKAQHIYARGLEAGVGFKAIENALEKAGFKNALIPQNAPYFSVWPKEFKTPATAERILDAYGEKKEGDAVKHLYRFPVIFHSTDPRSMVFSRMESYTASGLKFHSEIQGENPVCVTKAEVPKKNGKVIRMYGGRPDVVLGPCVPLECDTFLQKSCNKRTHILVSIPGCMFASEWVEIPTGSFYGTNQVENVLALIAKACGGNIPYDVQMGYKGAPIFWMEKVKNKAKYTDDSGDQRNSEQYVANLTAEIGLAQLLSLAEDAALRARRISQAFLPETVRQADSALAIEHQPILRPEDIVGGKVTPFSKVAEPVEVESQAPTEASRQHHAEEASIQSDTGNPPKSQARTSDIKTLQSQLSQACRDMGINPVVFLEYGTVRFGDGWGKNIEFLNIALDEIEQAKDSGDISGYIDELHDTVSEARTQKEGGSAS